MTRVYLSLGSNIDRERNIPAAIHDLRTEFGELEISPVYESQAVGFAGDAFYNLVVGFETDREVVELTRRLNAIEDAHGRVRGGEKYSSRTLDVDLLLYGDAVMHEQGLNVPRDEIERYAFVLRPLAEIAGQLRHPVNGQRYSELWAQFDAAEQPLKRVELAFD